MRDLDGSWIPKWASKVIRKQVNAESSNVTPRSSTSVFTFMTGLESLVASSYAKIKPKECRLVVFFNELGCESKWLWLTGRIAWARQLSRRIEQPMLAFEQHPSILKNVEAKKMIKNYNKLTKVLLEYEILYHHAWLDQVRQHVLCWPYFVFYCLFIGSINSVQ